MKKIIYICFGSLLLLSGCGIDNSAPTLELEDLVINRGYQITEATVIEKMVVDIKDNRKITRTNPIDVVNYNDIDFETAGDYTVLFRAIDDADNYADFKATLTVKPTQADLDQQEFEDTVAKYEDKLSLMEDCALASKTVIKQLNKQIESLNQTNYLNFSDRLDTQYDALLSKYQGSILNTQYEVIEQINRGLEIDNSDVVLNNYLTTVNDIDVSGDDLEQLSANYDKLIKIDNKVKKYITNLEESNSSVPADVYNNTFKSVSTCSNGGGRQSNVKVDIGAGDRSYYAYTNEFAQITYIEADEIAVQDITKESVTNNGDYCDGIASVFGSDTSGMTAYRIIGDNIGGASNAYNVIATNKTGSLEQITNEILSYGSATDFKAILSYASTNSYAPSSISISYKLGKETKSYTI